jgi:hypothetical protein
LLIVSLLAFVLGGIICAAMNHLLKISLAWSVATGIVVYIAVGLVVEELLFGRI